jgi:hypothetical protein
MQCYRRLLYLYPQEFRLEFGALLCQAFGDLLNRSFRSEGRRGLFRLWIRTFPDLFSSVVGQRFYGDSNWHWRSRWIAACSFGFLAGGLFTVLAMSFVRPVTLAVFGAGKWEMFLQTAGFYVLMYAIFALPVGWIQSRALSVRRKERVQWTILTVVGMAAWVLAVRTDGVMAHTATWVLCGSIMGMFQIILLIGRASRAWAWPPAFIAATTLAIVLPLEAMTFWPGHPHLPLIAIAALFGVMAMIGGTVFGILTAGPLEWILRSQEFSQKTTK